MPRMAPALGPTEDRTPCEAVVSSTPERYHL